MTSTLPIPKTNSIAVINRSAPFSDFAAQESLDFVMAMSNFGQELSVFFIGDGVYQLIKNQNANEVQRKQFTKGFAALAFYDVDSLYVCGESLAQRGITAEQLCLPVSVVDTHKCATLIANHQHAVTF